MKRTLLTIIILATAYTGKAQSLYDYNIVLHEFQYYFNHQQGDSIYTLLSDNVKNVLPLDKAQQDFNSLYYQLGEMSNYEFITQTDSFVHYRTNFRHISYTLLLALNKKNKIDIFRFMAYTDTTKPEKSNFHFDTKNGTLYGTLAAPQNIRKVPVVLIIPGAGPTDRNGNNPMGMMPNTYRMIADSLLKEGIASLRYDKRGVGESGNVIRNEDSLTFEDLVDDAIGFTQMLKGHWHFSKVIILGHGEGALVGMEVAKREKVAGFISVEGPGERADKIVEKKLKVQSKKLAKKATVLFDSLVNGYTVSNVDSSLTSIFDPSLQGYMRSILKYDPLKEIKTLNMPILIIQGTTDLLADEKETRKLEKACPDATVAIIDGMNHVLKQAPEERQQNMATYIDPKLPLSPGLMPAIVNFIRGIK